MIFHDLPLILKGRWYSMVLLIVVVGWHPTTLGLEKLEDYDFVFKHFKSCGNMGSSSDWFSWGFWMRSHESKGSSSMSFSSPSSRIACSPTRPVSCGTGWNRGWGPPLWMNFVALGQENVALVPEDDIFAGNNKARGPWRPHQKDHVPFPVINGARDIWGQRMSCIFVEANPMCKSVVISVPALRWKFWEHGHIWTAIV